MKYKFHIPVQQYGFLEIEGTKKDLEEMEKIYNKYAETPIDFSEGTFKELVSFTGEKILFNKETHQYTDLEGNPLISGSRYKRSLEKPFDLENISKAVGKKYDIEQQKIKEMWALNSKISTSFGNAIHYAVEHYIKHSKYNDKTPEDKEYHLPKHQWLRGVVESFPIKDEDILSEILVSDVKNKRAGQIDGLLIKDKKKKVASIIDIKSDGKVEDNVKGHFNQLSFYAHILMSFGWTIEKLVIWNYTDKWESYESPVLEIKKVGSDKKNK